MKTYFIMTYCFESGLWYLAKSLGDKLEKEGNRVIYVPKPKYILDGRVYRRTYPDFSNKNEKERKAFLQMHVSLPEHQQLRNAVNKYNTDVIISFETLMEQSRWISHVKMGKKVKVIDVPMLEWVSQGYIKNKSYKIFDEIWALTEQTKKAFRGFNVKEKSWDFVDRSLFYEEKKNSDVVQFYHAASLNPDYSSKNTDKVLSAFIDFYKEENPNAKLIVTGLVDKDLYKDNNNIEILNGVLHREELAKIYRQTDVVVAPSSKEGLGLNFYEALACGCKLITTNAPPMNVHDTEYLCDVTYFKKDRGPVASAIVEENEIKAKISKAYSDLLRDR